jgi:uncharacterized protein YyaL (SSP411 family)
VLEDYGDVAAGLLALYSATGNPHWVRLAGQLLDVVLDQFAAPTGGFFDTARDAEQLVRRPQDPTDNATPSGASASAGALFGYAALTGSQRHRAAGEQALNAGAGLLPTHARFAGWSAAVGEAALAGPVEVAVVGPPGPERRELESIARRSPSPGLVLAVSDPQAGAEVVPLLRGRTTIDGRPAAYVCRNFVCERPVTEPNTLAAALGVAPAPSR